MWSACSSRCVGHNKYNSVLSLIQYNTEVVLHIVVDKWYDFTYLYEWIDKNPLIIGCFHKLTLKFLYTRIRSVLYKTK